MILGNKQHPAYVKVQVPVRAPALSPRAGGTFPSGHGATWGVPASLRGFTLLGQ